MMVEFASGSLGNIKSFSLNKNSENIKITINFDDKIKQTWEFKL